MIDQETYYGYQAPGADVADGDYLDGDYDPTHCKHGNYTGYPGGPDYMCGLCEEGVGELTIPVYGDQVKWSINGGSEFTFKPRGKQTADGLKASLVTMLCDGHIESFTFDVERVIVYWTDEQGRG